MRLREEPIAEIVHCRHGFTGEQKRQTVRRDKGHVGPIQPQRHRKAKMCPQPGERDYLLPNVGIIAEQIRKWWLTKIERDLMRRSEFKQGADQLERVVFG